MILSEGKRACEQFLLQWGEELQTASLSTPSPSTAIKILLEYLKGDVPMTTQTPKLGGISFLFVSSKEDEGLV